MAEWFLVSKEERDGLRSLLAQAKHPPPPITRNRPAIPEEDPTAPETYLAYTSSSIPGRVGATVRSAQCDIYRIIEDQVVAIAGLSRLVFNYHREAIAAGHLIKVTRDKFGRWLAECPCGPPGEDDTDTGTGTHFYTGTGTLTFTGTGTSPDEGCDPVTVVEQDVRCEGGAINVYARTIWLDVVNGCLHKTAGSWTYLRSEGCCGCDPPTGTGGTGTADDDCDCQVMPAYYVTYVAGFTACASFNGYHTPARSGSSCTYYGTVGNVTSRLEVTTTGGGNQFKLTLIDISTGKQVVYIGTINDSDCCDTVDLAYFSGNCGTHPATLRIYPGTPCTAPTGTVGAGTSFTTGTGTIDAYTGTGEGTTIVLFPCECEVPQPLYAAFTGVGHTTGCMHGVTLELTDVLGGGTSLRGSAPCGTGEVTLVVACDGMSGDIAVTLYCNGVQTDNRTGIACPPRPVMIDVTLTTFPCDTILNSNYRILITE